jgi:hypothetical protein
LTAKPVFHHSLFALSAAKYYIRAEERYVRSIQELFPDFNGLPAAAQKVFYVLYCALMGEQLPKALSAEAALIRENNGRLLGALGNFSEVILGYSPWLVHRAQLALRYRKAIEQINLGQTQDTPIEIEFSPTLEQLPVGQGL